MMRVYDLIVHRPKSILFIILLLTGFFAYHAQHIRLDSSVESLLPKGDTEKTYYDEVRGLFGSDEIGVIGIIADNVYTPQTLRKIKRLTEEIRQIPEVKNVISLTNAPDIITSVAKESTLLVPDVNLPHAAAGRTQEAILEQPIYLKNLVAATGEPRRSIFSSRIWEMTSFSAAALMTPSKRWLPRKAVLNSSITPGFPTSKSTRPEPCGKTWPSSSPVPCSSLS